MDIGIAVCQRPSRSLSESRPLTCIAMKVARYGAAPSEPPAKPHLWQGKGVYFPSALLTPGTPFLGQLPTDHSSRLSNTFP
jgi:hypothetical protein